MTSKLKYNTYLIITIGFSNLNISNLSFWSKSHNYEIILNEKLSDILYISFIKLAD